MKQHDHYPDPEGPEEHSPESIFKTMDKKKSIKERIKEWLQIVGYFFIDCWGWLCGLCIYCFRSIQRPGIFYGYGSYFWAGKYAEKRTRKWRPEWDQDGKVQGTFPIMETKLLVCSKLELNIYKKNKLVNKNLKPRKAIKKSYYTTKVA